LEEIDDSNGEYADFITMDLIEIADYPQKKQAIFEALETSGKYFITDTELPKIYLQEGEHQRFLQYFFSREHTCLADPYFTKLAELAPEETFEMYQREIEQDLLPVAGRKNYQITCKKIKKLMKIDRKRVYLGLFFFLVLVNCKKSLISVRFFSFDRTCKIKDYKYTYLVFYYCLLENG
jgi:hypothetical protein